jgi:hypothetical protein
MMIYQSKDAFLYSSCVHCTYEYDIEKYICRGFKRNKTLNVPLVLLKFQFAIGEIDFSTSQCKLKNMCLFNRGMDSSCV